MERRPQTEEGRSAPRRDAEGISERMKTFALLRRAMEEGNAAEVEGKLGGVSKPELDEFEAIMKNEDISLQEKQDLLAAKIKEYQQKILEVLPEYPAKRKVAVIINGDTDEERHTGNVQRAMKALEARGFEEFYVMGGKDVPKSKGVFQFDVSAKGMGEMFGALQQNLGKDSLVFVYGTGHGEESKGGSMVIGDEEVGKEELVKYFQTIKDSGSRGVFVFDNCFSGAFPQAIVESGVEGIAMSPGVEGVETHCQFFVPSFFEGMSEGRDLDQDGKTTMREIFFTALQIYNEKRNSGHTYGEYRESVPEVKLDEFDALLQQDKPVLIEITATWCPSCKKILGEITNTMAFLGDKLSLYKITDDDPAKERETRQEAIALYERIGLDVENIVFPSFYLYQKGKGFRQIALDGGSTTADILAKLQAEAGVKIDYSYFLKKVFDEGTITKEQYQKLGRKFSDPEIIALAKFEKNGPLNDELVEQYLAYDSRFDAASVPLLVWRRVGNEVAVKYDKRFNGQEVSVLALNVPPDVAIPNEVAIKYDARFKGNDIYFLNKAKIVPEKANAYPKRFRVQVIIALCVTNILPDKVALYDERFSDYDVVQLLDAKVENDAAVKYDKSFYGEDIAILEASGVGAEIANLYIGGRKFTGEDILLFVRSKVASEVAQSYDKRFDPYGIKALQEAGISNEEAMKYGGGKSGGDIAILYKAGVSDEIFKSYGLLDVRDVADLYKAGVSPDLLKEYSEDLEFDDIALLHKNGIGPKEALEYLEREEGHYSPIMYFKMQRDIVEYDKRFKGAGVIALILFKISNDEALKYDERFDGFAIKVLYEDGVSASTASKYARRFHAKEIANFYKERWSYQAVNEYDARFSAEEIMAFLKAGISNESALEKRGKDR